MAEQLLPIATFRRPIDAELAKSKLEAGGVRSFIEHASITRINPVYVSGADETKLLVRAADRTRSLAILEEDPAEARAALRKVFDDLDSDGCPRCGSSEVRFGRYSTWTIVLALLLVGILLRVPRLLLLLLLPLLFFRRHRARCSDCQHRWWEK